MTTIGNRLSIQHDPLLEEWFVNDARGLEQGWTVKEKPPGVGERLRLELVVRGGLRAAVSETSVAFVGADGGTVLTYGGLKAWDATGRELAVGFVTGDGDGKRFTLEADMAGAMYPVTIDPVAQRAYLKASNTAANDGFGWSVAVSKDTVVIGAAQEDSNATGVNGDGMNDDASSAGAAYVFVRKGLTWSQQAYLKASNAEAGDAFGGEAAVDGDTVVIGAVGEDSSATGVNGNQQDNSATSAGAVYVFVRSNGIWTQQAYLKASNTGGVDRFGSSVALHGDTLVVGAAYEDGSATGVNGPQGNGASDSGAAYVFVRSNGMWTQQAYLKASNTGESDRFGESVAISGDTIVIGALSEDSNARGVNGDQSNDAANNCGAAYVFVRSNGTWTQQAYLKASNADAGDSFGESVAVSGDTIVVGASSEDSNARGINGNEANNSAGGSGAAYVFVRSNGTWAQQAYLKASNAESADNFGGSVAVNEDTIMVGAPSEDSNARGVNGNETNNAANSSGAVYMFTRKGVTWRQSAYLKASNTGSSDGFGGSVAVSGNTVAVSAGGESSIATGVNGDVEAQNNNNASGAGAAYLFHAGQEIHSLARASQPAPGAVGIAFATPGRAVINGDGRGRTLFDTSLIGGGSSKGLNRALYSTLGPLAGPDLLLQRGAGLGGFAGLPTGAKITALLSPTLNQSGLGVFQVTVTGKGIPKAGNRLLIKDNGAFLSPVLRTGDAIAGLGGAAPAGFLEVAQHYTEDLLAVCYTLQRNRSVGVTARNDSGILLINHAGTVRSFGAREGQPVFGGGGVFGQFPGRVALATGDQMFFISPYVPDGTRKAKQGVFTSTADGGVALRYGPAQGDSAFLGNGETYRSFLTVNERGSSAVLRATLKGGPKAQNEGIWGDGNVLQLRKGTVFDAVNLPGLFVKRILKFWPVGADQLVVRAVLGGAGVKRTNNQVLLLRKADGKWQVLLRTGDAAPGVALATVSKLSAVEVDRMNGHYAVLGVLTGTSARANQALWMGQTSLGDDTARAVERLPRLVLRKGDIYTTAVTPADPIRGLVMNPVDEKTGAGARGQGQMVGGDGSVAMTIIGRQKVVVRTNISVRLRTLVVTIVRDRKVRELVVVEP